jgi:hypothetical protein
MEDVRRSICIATRIDVAISAREVVARVVFPVFDLVEALNGQLNPFVLN